MVKCGQGLQVGGLAAGARLLGVVHGCEACAGSAGVGPLTCDMARWACGDGALGRQQDLLSARWQWQRQWQWQWREGRRTVR